MARCIYFSESGSEYSCALVNFTVSRRENSRKFYMMEFICKSNKNVDCPFKHKSGCIYGGFPSLEKCDGAFGPGCKYQWNCPTYSEYLKKLPWD